MGYRVKSRWCGFRLSHLVLAGLGLLNGVSHAEQIVILSNGGDAPYAQVVEGFKQQLGGRPKTGYLEINVAELRTDRGLLERSLAKQNPKLIFALGLEAVEQLKSSKNSIPVIATLVMKPDSFSAGITGVSLAYPLNLQIQWLKKFFPQQSKVAVLFNPAENTKTVNNLTKLAADQGFEIIPVSVESPKQLPDALEQLAKNIEILFAIPDEIAMSPKTAKEVLLASFRNRVPLVGLSDNWVKSGALYALSWDYNDLGKQCAVQSQKILDGQTILQVAPETPRKLTYTVNTKIAEHMNIQIPDHLQKNARAVFE